MKTFLYLEDYLFWIAGVINHNEEVVIITDLARIVDRCNIALARYDEEFIFSVVEQLGKKIGLTDKQFALAEKVVTKYQRQLRAHFIDLPESFNSSLGIRKIDRTSRVYMVDDETINVRFPYNADMIAEFREASKSNIGTVKWNSPGCVWQLSLTEDNVSWIVAYAALHNFDVDEEVLHLFERIAEVERVPFRIELVRIDGQYMVTNAAASLEEYIAPFKTNKAALLAHSGLLAYSISEELLTEVQTEKGAVAADYLRFCTNRRYHMHYPSSSNLTIIDIITWAKDANRLPVVVYNVNATATDHVMLALTSKFDSVCTVLSKKDLISPADVYYTNIAVDVKPTVCISYQSMLFGTKRTWINSFEQVIYTHDEISKNNTI